MVGDVSSVGINKNSSLTLAISSGERAPCMSCLFAKISSDDPDSLCYEDKKQNYILKRKKTS